jgi:hypothetical protein
VYGPVRTVVWQGSAGDRRPYADLTGNSEVNWRNQGQVLLTGRGFVDSRRSSHALRSGLQSFAALRLRRRIYLVSVVVAFLSLLRSLTLSDRSTLVLRSGLHSFAAPQVAFYNTHFSCAINGLTQTLPQPR